MSLSAWATPECRPSTFPFRFSHNGSPTWRDGYSAPRCEMGFFCGAISADAQVSQGSAAEGQPAEREGGRLRQQADERRGAKPVAVGLTDKFGASSGVHATNGTKAGTGKGTLHGPTEHNWTCLDEPALARACGADFLAVCFKPRRPALSPGSQIKEGARRVEIPGPLRVLHFLFSVPEMALLSGTSVGFYGAGSFGMNPQWN